MPEMDKETRDFFEASKKITGEKLREVQGQITESQVLTCKYLRWLHTAASASNPHKKYRG